MTMPAKTHPDAVPLAEADAQLDAQIARLRQAAGRDAAAAGFRRIEIPVIDVDPLDWLAARPETTRIFWTDRERHLVVAAVGSLDDITSHSETDFSALCAQMQDRLPAQFPRMRYYGGGCFDGRVPDPAWSAFGAYHFILPRRELLRDAQGCFLCANIYPAEDPARDAALSNAAGNPHPPPASLPAVQSSTDTPDQVSWLEHTRQCLTAIARGDYEKIVLARQCQLRLQHAPDAVTIVRALRQRTADAYLFAMQFAPRQAFVGAAPEQLFKRQGEELWSEALAGTAFPRSPQQRQGFLASDKQRREHQIVVQMIRQVLTPYCRILTNPDQPTVIPLRDGYHLRTQFFGQLNPVVSEAVILPALHPTPAVCGSPTAAARDEIRGREPFHRGWYAGPVGFIGRDESEFCVAIRSALLADDQLTLFAGAGLVRGSDPDEEWAETEYKMQTIKGIFS